MTETGTLTIEGFLLARIVDDYRKEADGAPVNSMQEVAARLRANARRASIGFAISGRLAPYERTEASKYADHPDFRPEWRP